CPAADAPPATPTVIVTDDKGEGPVRLYYPGLEGRPTLSAEHVQGLAEALREAASKRAIPTTPGPGAAPPPTMTVYGPPPKPGDFPRGVPDGFQERHEMHLKVEPHVEITPEGKAMLRWET